MGCSFEEGQNQIITHTFTDNNADYFCDCGHVRFKPGVPNGDQQARLLAESTAREEVLAARVEQLSECLQQNRQQIRKITSALHNGRAIKCSELVAFLDGIADMMGCPFPEIRETLNEEK